MSNKCESKTDEELFALLRSDRKDAFEILFKRHYHSLWYYCQKFIDDKSTAEEVVQEFFINLWEKRSDLTIHGPINSYFYVSIKNRSFNYLRKKFQNFTSIEENLDIIFYEEEHLITEDLEKNIEKAIDKLPEKCKVIFLLSRRSFLSYKEIGEHLNLSVKTVETQMGIALKKLKELLQKYSVSLIVLSTFIIRS